ncbi:LIM domain containing protein [Entamoeba nuttalli P19]|uniref:LIM domain containing protein n=1 Tax=Entamoeba nuttalli (strain P19) TaxID=1076696 RepID=K2HQS0_ENTNP|nr:LIM domain containing protein [Entamoeba nuttalli P19]EKE38300.1 LIM domain containing protein [Entamoeba nuttalli P19]|eukprot:XP_008859369.1 LIM domain containing protein [Entamoeba nuttalli P19]
MSDLDDLLNSLNDTPATNQQNTQQDELDDVLNALNDMVEKKDTNKQKKEDDLDDLLDSLDAKPKEETKPKKADDLDDLLNSLDDKPKPTSSQSSTKVTTESTPKKDDLDDLLDGLEDKPKSTPQPAPKKDDLDDLLDVNNKPAPKKDDLDDLLDGLEDKPKPAAKPKTAPKDDLDDLLDGIDSTAPKRQSNAPVPITAVINEDPNICAECGQPLGPQRITALGRSYHPDHFVCKNCKKPLGTNPFHNVENSPYCKDCFIAKFAKMCARCGKPITTNCVSALGKTYHSECFVCTKCSKPFPTPSFFQKDGNPYCEECYKEECAAKCSNCGKPIIGPSLSALGKKYHPECFVCSVCKAPFPRGQFYNLDGKPVCAEHYSNHASTNICGRCGKPIAPGVSFISAMGQKFHPEHFVCSFCVNPLTESSFKENNGKPYCFTCYGKLFG